MVLLCSRQMASKFRAVQIDHQPPSFQKLLHSGSLLELIVSTTKPHCCPIAQFQVPCPAGRLRHSVKLTLKGPQGQLSNALCFGCLVSHKAGFQAWMWFQSLAELLVIPNRDKATGTGLQTRH